MDIRTEAVRPVTKELLKRDLHAPLRELTWTNQTNHPIMYARDRFVPNFRNLKNWARKFRPLRELRARLKDVERYMAIYGRQEILESSVLELKRDLQMVHLILMTSHTDAGVTAALDTADALMWRCRPLVWQMMGRLAADNISAR